MIDAIAFKSEAQRDGDGGEHVPVPAAASLTVSAACGAEVPFDGGEIVCRVAGAEGFVGLGEPDAPVQRPGTVPRRPGGAAPRFGGLGQLSVDPQALPLLVDPAAQPGARP
ncbi:hypothetical protein ACFYYD_29145 [Streptomyces bluensis]|uniref:hypothetical protein n=1 Tax=Streptomyces bluensis TaxID=33897 RepID=UPI0033330AA6